MIINIGAGVCQGVPSKIGLYLYMKKLMILEKQFR